MDVLKAQLILGFFFFCFPKLSALMRSKEKLMGLLGDISPALTERGDPHTNNVAAKLSDAPNGVSLLKKIRSPGFPPFVSE